jgi:hypothetical protein
MVNIGLKQLAQSAEHRGASQANAENTCPALATESHGAQTNGSHLNTATKFLKACLSLIGGLPSIILKVL